MRRSGDVLIACVLLAITLPLLIITAAAIGLESSGPILERRVRIGAGGRQFQVLRFGTTTQGPGQIRPIWQITEVMPRTARWFENKSVRKLDVNAAKCTFALPVCREGKAVVSS